MDTFVGRPETNTVAPAGVGLVVDRRPEARFPLPGVTRPVDVTAVRTRPAPSVPLGHVATPPVGLLEALVLVVVLEVVRPPETEVERPPEEVILAVVVDIVARPRGVPLAVGRTVATKVRLVEAPQVAALEVVAGHEPGVPVAGVV